MHFASVNTHQLEKRNETIIYELQKPTKNIFMIDISENKYEGLRFENIFTRHRYIGPEGKALHLRSHQPRHLLNTIGQRNGMSDLDPGEVVRKNTGYPKPGLQPRIRR